MATASTLLPRLRSGLWIALTLFLSTGNFVFSPAGQGEFTPYTALSMLGAFTVPFVLLWRRKFPETVMVISLVACALLSIGSTVAWVALGSLFRYRDSRTWRDPWLWLAAGGTAAVTYLAVARDLRVPTSEGSMLGTFLEEPAGPGWRSVFPWYTEAFVTVIMMSLVLGAAVLVRAQRRLNLISSTAAERQSENVYLNQELARYEERERIARELHDSLGSKLAAVSMLSGAVRADPKDTAAVRSHAEQLQLTAQEATAEMHEIVRTYRSQPAPATSLIDLQGLVDEARRHGQIINSHLEIDTESPAPTAVERAAFRVVQEIITNAAKHAPRQMLTLHATGGPALGGIEIYAANPVCTPAPGAGGPASGGSGLVGAGERVEQLGGWVHAGERGHVFEVRARIPWRVSPATYP